MPLHPPLQWQKTDDGEVTGLLLLEDWYDAFEPVYRVVRDSIQTADLGATALPLTGEFLEDLFGTIGAGAMLLFLTALDIVIRAAENAIDLVKFRYQNAGKTGKGKSGHSKFGGGPIYVEVIDSSG